MLHPFQYSSLVLSPSAILHDEDVYPEPTRFNPDRYFKDGKWNPDVPDPTPVVFGFGRRICPGRFLLRESMWIAVAMILSTLTISKAVDEAGHEITPEESYTPGLIA